MIPKWEELCRLCGSDTNANITIKNEDQNIHINDYIFQYFSVNMNQKQMPAKLCSDCLNFLHSIINFEKQIKNVQIMFSEILDQKELGCEIDYNKIREKYGHKQIKIEQQSLGDSNSFRLEKAIETSKLYLKNDSSRENLLALKLKNQSCSTEIFNTLTDKSSAHGKRYLNNSNKELEKRMKLDANLIQESNSDPFNVEIEQSKLLQISPAEILELELESPNVSNNIEKTKSLGKLSHKITTIKCGEQENKNVETFEEIKVEPYSIQDDSNLVKQIETSESGSEIEMDKSKMIKIQCEYCPMIVYQISSYFAHLKNKHDIDREKFPKNLSAKLDNSIECKLCGKRCGNRGSYARHMKMHKETKFDELNLFKCTICPKRFKQKKNFDRHKRNHLLRKERFQAKKNLPCLVCEKKFLNEFALQIHTKTVHLKQEPFACDICGKTEISQRLLDSHKLNHTEAERNCKTCSELLRKQRSLNRHSKTHENLDDQCLKCNEVLENNVNLKEHMLTHNTVQKITCFLCGNAFKCKRSLRLHMLIHTGLKPYKCSFCDKSFSNGSNCTKHEKITHPVEYAELLAKGPKIHCKIPTFNELEEMLKEIKENTTS